MIDEEREDALRLELRLVANSTPGLLVNVVAYLRHENCFRISDERGATVDLDEHVFWSDVFWSDVFWSGERHHWEAYARERLRDLAERASRGGVS